MPYLLLLAQADAWQEFIGYISSAAKREKLTRNALIFMALRVHFSLFAAEDKLHKKQKPFNADKTIRDSLQ